jgi:hypothetical protein
MGMPSRSLEALPRKAIRPASAASPSPAWQPPALASLRAKAGGGRRARTDDILLAKQVLYQLSYAPVCAT